MNIIDLLRARACEIPDAPAVLTPEGILSFGALERAVRWTAESFRKAGLAPGDHVAVAVPESVSHLVASLALAHIGVGHLALHDSDPPERQRELVRRLGIVATIADCTASKSNEGARIDPPPARLAELKCLTPPEIDIARGQDWPWHLMATSGTTGEPKVMSLSHARSIARLAGRTHGLPIGPGFSSMSLTHIAFTGAKQILLAHLLSGSCLAFTGPLTEAEALADVLKSWRINFVAGAPIWAMQLLDIAREGEFLLPGVDAFQVSSTVVPESLRHNIRQRLTPNLHIAYGSNEVGMIATAPPALLDSDASGTVGKPAPGKAVDVVDEQGRVLPIGSAGRLRVKSAGLAEGYFDDPRETARSFRDGWFITDDRVERTPGGTLIHHGRADDMIVYDGVNIYPAEIENVLLRHAAVREAVAVPMQLRVRGHVPVAAVVLGAAATENELMAHCRSRLGIRSPVAIQRIPKFPRNARGKVKRQDLAKSIREAILANTRQSARLRAPEAE